MARHRTEVRQHEIVASARELIISQGVAAVTIRNIAKKSKISEGAIYKHFKSKRDILLMLIEDFESNLTEAIDLATTGCEDPIEILKNIMLVHLKYTEERRSELFVITAASVHFDDALLRKRILEVIENYKTGIKSILIEAGKSGKIRPDIDIDQVSLTFFGLIQISAIQFALTNYTASPVKKFETLWDIFLRGVLKGRGK